MTWNMKKMNPRLKKMKMMMMKKKKKIMMAAKTSTVGEACPPSRTMTATKSMVAMEEEVISPSPSSPYQYNKYVCPHTLSNLQSTLMFLTVTIHVPYCTTRKVIITSHSPEEMSH